MMRILNAKRVEYSNEKEPDLELLLNRICNVFNPKEEEALADNYLQAALSAQVYKSNYEHRVL